MSHILINCKELRSSIYKLKLGESEVSDKIIWMEQKYNFSWRFGFWLYSKKVK